MKRIRSDTEILREREATGTTLEEFSLQDVPHRLKALSQELAHLIAVIQAQDTIDIGALIRKSCYYIEWCAPDLLPDRVGEAARLVDIQRGLTHWYWIWDKEHTDADQRQKLANQAQAWSDEVLKMSGLLEQE